MANLLEVVQNLLPSIAGRETATQIEYMYSRQHRTAQNSAKSSDTPVSNQFAPRGFVVQPQAEEVTTQQQETPDLQTQSVTEQQFDHGITDVSKFARSFTPSTPRLQMKLNIGQQETVQRHQEKPNKALQMKPDVQRHQEKEELQLKPASSYLQRHNEMSKEDEAIQRQAENNGSFEADNNLESRIRANQSSGQPLDGGVRAFMEPRFGHSFANVRVHTNSEAVQMNKELHAQAFTNGQHIYFNEGKYSPNSNDGKQLLAHELTHTIQQTGGSKLQLQKQSNSSCVGCQCPTCVPVNPTIQRRIAFKQSIGTQNLLNRSLTDVVQRHADTSHSMSCQCSNCGASGIKIQTKLTVGAPGDRYEQEADQIAAQVMRMPEPQQADTIQRHQEDEAHIQRQPITTAITVQQPANKVIQRHTAYEHYLLGEVAPDQLAEIPFIRQAIQQKKQQQDLLADTISNPINLQNVNEIDLTKIHQEIQDKEQQIEQLQEPVRHTLLQQMELLENFKDDPEYLTTDEARTDENGNVIDVGTVIKKQDGTWQVPYVEVPVKGDDKNIGQPGGEKIVVLYSEINTFPDFFGNPETIANTRKKKVLHLLQGVRQQTYLELDNLYKEIFGESQNVLSRIYWTDKDFDGARGPRGQAVNAWAYEKRTEMQVDKATKREDGEKSEQYFAALERNACHFAPYSWDAWEKYHETALGKARAAYASRELNMDDQAAKYSNEALLQNAFGEHYLQDSFAAGHLIDKTKIMQEFTKWIAANGKDLGSTDQAEEAWKMAKMVANTDLQSDPQALDNLMHRREKNGQEQGFVEEAAELIGMSATPEIILLMWWRAKAKNNNSMKHLTPTDLATQVDVVPAVVKKNEEKAEELLDELVELGFVEKKKDNVNAVATITFGHMGKTNPVYSINQAQVNVLNHKKSPYESTVATKMRSKGKRNFPKEAAEFNLAAYNSFMSNAYIQGSTKYFHDTFCKEGLEVITGTGVNIGTIYGDANMLNAGAQKGVKYSAETAQLSRQAVFKTIHGEDLNPEEKTNNIRDRFPVQVVLRSEGTTLDLANWNAQKLCIPEMFEKAASNAAKLAYKFKSGDGISGGNAIDVARIVKHDGDVF